MGLFLYSTFPRSVNRAAKEMPSHNSSCGLDCEAENLSITPVRTSLSEDVILGGTER